MGESQQQQPQPQVIPSFWVDKVEPVRGFYMDKLGFGHLMGIVGKDGDLDFAIVARDGAMVMLGRPQDQVEGSAAGYPTRRPLEIYFYVKDVDAYHAEVKGRGVPISEPLTTQWWGDRTFAVKDPYGYVLWFCQNVAPLAPPPGLKVV